MSQAPVLLDLWSAIVSHQAYWDEICRFLGSNATASMATVDENGHPHNVNVWYAIDDQGRMYFVSSLDSAHSRHMLRDPHVAVTVYGYTDDPMHIHGVQIKGACTIIAPPDGGNRKAWDHAWKTFTTRYPFVQQVDMWCKAVESQSFFCITPMWVRWLDNRKGFGFKVEINLASPKSNGRNKASVKRISKTAKSKVVRFSRKVAKAG